MAKQRRRLGGLAGLNTGQIGDCYTRMVLRSGQEVWAGGLCGENRGSLSRCYFQGRIIGRGRKAGLAAGQGGQAGSCFWVRAGEEGGDFTDPQYAREEAEAFAPGSIELSGFDTASVWHPGEAGQAPELYDLPPEEPEWADGQVVEIGDRQELLALAQRVNRGEADGRTLYRLTADIDLGGRSWTPIGLDPATPFQGCFDGGGHLICNFVLSARKHPNAGLFGCVGSQGMVHSLRLECAVIGAGAAAGPLCALNHGQIVNCVCQARLEPSRYTGGLVGQNGGVLRRCCSFGAITPAAPIPWPLSALLLLLLCLPAPLFFAFHAQTQAQEVFAPVILDPNALPIQPDGQPPAPPPQPEQEDTGASFTVNAQMRVSAENYAGAAGLRCPAWSTRGFVATVRVSGQELARAGYQTGAEYVTLYQSGLIQPGYGVDVITLGPLPGGSGLPPGEYELSVLLEFYDVQTNEKSSVNTVVPMEVTVTS